MATKKPPIRKHILEGKQALKEIMQTNLSEIASAMIKQIMARARRSTPSTILDSIKNVDQPGVNDYKSILKTGLSVIASDAIAQVRKEIPKAKHIKLSEDHSELLLSEWDDLPPDLQKRLLAESQLLVGTQLSDLEKAIYFQFTSSHDSTDSMDVLEGDITSAAEDYIAGSSIDSGADIVSAEVINDARNAFFMQEDVSDQLDALQFVNGDPVTTICTDLNGVIFSSDDPLVGRFQPPFHWNCKTYIIPILKGNVDPEDIESLEDYSGLQSEMQFSEEESKTVFLLQEMQKVCHSHKSS